MKNDRWQSLPGGKRIQTGGADRAIQPSAQTQTLHVGIFKRAMADSMNRLTNVSQFAGQMAADETVGTGNPHGHNCALRQTNEYSRPGLLSKCSANESSAAKTRLRPRTTRHRGLTGIFCESFSTTAARRLSNVYGNKLIGLFRGRKTSTVSKPASSSAPIYRPRRNACSPPYRRCS